jgi:hypothetical protein
MSHLDSLTAVGWFTLCVIVYALAMFVMVVLCKGIALADRKRPL